MREYSVMVCPRMCLLALILSVCRLSAADVPVAPGMSINAAIASAPAGARIVLEPGRYAESVVVTKPVTLAARRGGTAIIDGGSAERFQWIGAGRHWQARVPWHPIIIVVGHRCYFPNDWLAEGFTYGEGVVHVRTDGTDPNDVPVSVNREDADAGIAVEADDVALEGLRIRCHRAAGIMVKGDRCTVRDCFIEGARYGIDCGMRRGTGHTIEHCEFSNFPLYTLSREQDYETQRRNYGAEGFDAEVTSIRIGSAGSEVRCNYAYEMADGIQPRTMQAAAASRRTDIRHNVIRNCWDDGVEFDSRGSQNLRMHHNVILDALCAVAPSPVNVGPVSFDHNLVLLTREFGLRKCTVFKFDGSWSGDIHRNLQIVHNTITGRPSHGLYWCEPLGAENVVCANNILDIPGRKAFPDAFAATHNFRGNPGFVRTSPSLDLRLRADAPAVDQGEPGHDAVFFHTSAGLPDCGALEHGETWRFPRVGPRWANQANMPQRPPLPAAIDPAWVGLAAGGQPGAPPD